MVPFPKETFIELTDKKIVVFDWEANGFLEVVDKTFCGTAIDARTREVRRFVTDIQGSVEEALAYLDTFDVLVGHNLIGYDFPMLLKLYGWTPRADIIILDTLWLSRMFNPDYEGGHSLAAWGLRLGNPKIEYHPIHDKQQLCYDPESDLKETKGWEEAHYTENMGDYCDRDVEVNLDLYNKLLGLLSNFTWKSIQCEMQTAKIIQRQMNTGFAFDYREAEMLHAKLMERKNELEDIVHQTFKPLPKLVRVVQPKVKMDGMVSSVGLKSLGDTWGDLIVPPEFTGTKGDKMYTSGSFSLIDWPEFSLGSRQQIAERLTLAGYKLTRFTPKTDKGGGGNPIVDETTLADAVRSGIAEAKPLDEYFMITKREAMVKSWITKAQWHEDQGIWRIHGFVNTLGAVTNRMTHNSPNVSQVPAGGSPYGKECRALFTVRPGYTLVGCDASGLELRCLAHYMKDRGYSDSIIHGNQAEGTDIHSVNQRAAGLATRDSAKTFIYGFLYGAGDAKIGSIVGGSGKQGKALKNKFLDATPALKALRAKIKTIAENRKWLKGVDGRILHIRSPHAALNTLLQGMGAVVMKYWVIEVTKNADREGIDWDPVGNIHDEGQFEVLTKDVPRFKEITEAAFLKVTKDLNLFCPLAGEAMEGSNWSQTH